MPPPALAAESGQAGGRSGETERTKVPAGVPLGEHVTFPSPPAAQDACGGQEQVGVLLAAVDPDQAELIVLDLIARPHAAASGCPCHLPG